MLVFQVFENIGMTTGHHAHHGHPAAAAVVRRFLDGGVPRAIGLVAERPHAPLSRPPYAGRSSASPGDVPVRAGIGR